MDEKRLAEIEAQCRISNRYVAIGDVLELVAEVRRLQGLSAPEVLREVVSAARNVGRERSRLAVLQLIEELLRTTFAGEHAAAMRESSLGWLERAEEAIREVNLAGP